MNRKWTLWVVTLLALFLLTACGGQTEPPVSTPEPIPTVTPVPTPVPTNDPIDLGLVDTLTDDNPFTWVGGDIVLTNPDKKIGSVYLVWRVIPDPWTLTADGAEVQCGQNGFIHEYVQLSQPADQVVLHAAGGQLGEVYAFEAGAQLPDWVQVWQEPWDDADLLVLPTHADDEHLFFGGLLPYYAVERDLKVQVVYLTHHWVQDPRRPHELLDGLWEAGIRAYPIMGPLHDMYASSLGEALRLYDRSKVTEFQVELLRRFRPSVVVGHDLNGEYGHGVHILNAVTLTDAVFLASDPTQYPASAEKYGTWDTPKVYLHLYEHNRLTMDWEAPMASFGGRTGIQVAEDAYAHHVSQHEYMFYVYREGDDYDSRQFGLFRSLVGPDLEKNDLFENIVNTY